MSRPPSFQPSLHRFLAVLKEDAPPQWESDWPYMLLLIVITLLTGPWLLLATSIQRWNVSLPWEVQDHWKATKQAAIFFLLLDGLLISACTRGQPQALLSIWLPPIIARGFLWWMMFALLAPTIAWGLEYLDPQTHKLTRVLLPHEVPTPQPPQLPVPAAGTTGKRTPKTASSGTKKPKTATKKYVGRKVPIGEILLNEQQERERKRTQINYIQPPAMDAPLTVMLEEDPTPAQPTPQQKTTSSASSASPKPAEDPPQKPPVQHRQPRTEIEPFDGIF